MPHLHHLHISHRPAHSEETCTMLTIETMNGKASKEDIERALAAAAAVLAAFEWKKGDPMKIDPGEAYAAYSRHISDEEYLRSPRDTILIAAWEAAQSAGDIALTEGWHDPNGDAMFLSVR